MKNLTNLSRYSYMGNNYLYADSSFDSWLNSHHSGGARSSHYPRSTYVHGAISANAGGCALEEMSLCDLPERWGRSDHFPGERPEPATWIPQHLRVSPSFQRDS